MWGFIADVKVASHIVSGTERILGIDLTSDKQKELEDHTRQLLDEFSPEKMIEERVFRGIEQEFRSWTHNEFTIFRAHS